MIALKALPIILLSVSLNALAQLFLKQGMLKIGYFDFAWHNIVPIAWQAMTNPFIFSGLVCYAVSVVTWMMVLSRVDVSFAYPMLSVGYIMVAVAGYYLFNEHLTWVRVMGIFVIIFGVYLLTRTAQ